MRYSNEKNIVLSFLMHSKLYFFVTLDYLTESLGQFLTSHFYTGLTGFLLYINT
jgi:hypothetical protein